MEKRAIRAFRLLPLDELFRSPDDPQLYYVFEIYESEAALDAHRNGAHMAITRDRVRSALDGAITATVVNGL